MQESCNETDGQAEEVISIGIWKPDSSTFKTASISQWESISLTPVNLVNDMMDSPFQAASEE